MLIIFSLSVLLHIFLLVNTQFTLWPEMVIYPYLMNNNFVLYKDIINPYQPIFSYFLAFFSSIFGYSVAAFSTFTIIITIIIDLLVFLISLSLTKSRIGAIFSTLFFIILSVPFKVNGLWYDLAQTPFILLSLYFFNKFLENKDRKSMLRTVVLLTIAYFIKQQILWTIIWFSLYFFIFNKGKGLLILKRNASIILIPMITSLFFLILFFLKGALSDYSFWTLTFPFFKASTLPGYVDFPNKRQILVVLLLTVLALPYFLKKKNIFFFGTYLSTLPFAYPRFDYFHLIPALTVISLVFWPSIRASSKRISVFAAISVSLFALSLFGLRSYRNDWHKETRFFESNIYELSASIKEMSERNSKLIFIQNGPEQLYPLAGIIPSKPWGTQFPWYMELEGTQNRIIKGLQNEHVELILARNYDQGEKYDLGSYKPEILSSYIENNYSPYLQFSPELTLKKKNENQ